MPRLVLCLAILAGAASSVAAQEMLPTDQKVNLFVNNCPKFLTPPPLVREGKTYVPLRGGAEALGGSVTWDEATQTATVTYGSKVARIKSSQGITVQGRVLIPLRLMAETLGCKVGWNAKDARVDITTPPSAPMPPVG